MSTELAKIRRLYKYYKHRAKNMGKVQLGGEVPSFTEFVDQIPNYLLSPDKNIIGGDINNWRKSDEIGKGAFGNVYNVVPNDTLKEKRGDKEWVVKIQRPTEARKWHSDKHFDTFLHMKKHYGHLNLEYSDEYIEYILDEYIPSINREFYYTSIMAKHGIGPEIAPTNRFFHEYDEKCTKEVVQTFLNKNYNNPSRSKPSDVYSRLGGSNYKRHLSIEVLERLPHMYRRSAMVLKKYNMDLHALDTSEHIYPDDLYESIRDQLKKNLTRMINLNLQCSDFKPQNVLINLPEGGQPVDIRISDLDGNYCNCFTTDDKSSVHGDDFCKLPVIDDDSKKYVKNILLTQFSYLIHKNNKLWPLSLKELIEWYEILVSRKDSVTTALNTEITELLYHYFKADDDTICQKMQDFVEYQIRVIVNYRNISLNVSSLPSWIQNLRGDEVNKLEKKMPKFRCVPTENTGKSNNASMYSLLTDVSKKERDVSKKEFEGCSQVKVPLLARDKCRRTIHGNQINQSINLFERNYLGECRRVTYKQKRDKWKKLEDLIFELSS